MFLLPLLIYAGACSAVTRLPPASLRGPVPMAIRLTPTTGEDLARAMTVAMVGAPDSVFVDPFGPKPDADLPSRGQAFKANVSERAMAALAAQLDQAAIDDGAHCSDSTWPPVWHVRFLGPDLRVAREFNVPLSVVHCRALERSESLKDDPEMSQAMRTLIDLGGGPARLAPDEARMAILRGSMDTVTLSLVGASAALRLSIAGKDAVHLDEESMRSALHAALVSPEFATGMKRTLSDLPRRQPHAEIRVLDLVDGSPVLRLISYVSPADAATITQRIMASVSPSEAGAIRARIAGTDR